jgi:hypothetical protein
MREWGLLEVREQLDGMTIGADGVDVARCPAASLGATGIEKEDSDPLAPGSAIAS